MQTELTAKLKLIAFYLPQYHPIPENDAWWGKGFTEWTNVARSRPRFPGHYQPQLPADLGFYDLRLPETRHAQTDLAREYGIHGFCYYHYWFNGRRLLERPFNEVLTSGEPDFPFCLCWANENWTRAWDGGESEILIAQNYSIEDDLNHIRALIPAFLDPRYIRVDGKPLFLVYRANELPDTRATTDIWREEALKQGVGELFLCRVENHLDRRDPRAVGFDATVDFQPRYELLLDPMRRSKWWYRARRFGLSEMAYGTDRIYDYGEYVNRALRESRSSYPKIPCVFPSWDNSARRKSGAVIIRGSTPTLYQKWLEEQIREVEMKSSLDEKIVFINGWNEWAEGNHLEPCQKWGRAYLEATQMALLNTAKAYN